MSAINTISSSYLALLILLPPFINTFRLLSSIRIATVQRFNKYGSSPYYIISVGHIISYILHHNSLKSISGILISKTAIHYLKVIFFSFYRDYISYSRLDIIIIRIKKLLRVNVNKCFEYSCHIWAGVSAMMFCQNSNGIFVSVIFYHP